MEERAHQGVGEAGVAGAHLGAEHPLLVAAVAAHPVAAAAALRLRLAVLLALVLALAAAALA